MVKYIHFEAEHGNILPICLPKKGRPVNGTNCYGVGWGKTKSGELSTKLRQAKMTIVSNKECGKIFPVTQNQICAGTGKNTVCEGDSGGPLQCLNEDNTWTVEGITSYVEEHCRYFGAFTRVEKYIDWINDVIHHN